MFTGTVHKDAVAFQFVRVVGDQLRTYEPMTFKPVKGVTVASAIGQFLRQMVTGVYTQDDDRYKSSYATMDILNGNGDIIQDFGFSCETFRQAKAKLKFRVETH